MTRPTALFLVLAGLAAAAAALAYLPPSPVQNLLFAGNSPADLRVRLLAHADSAANAPLDAGEAWHFAGRSWARGGSADSALVAYLRAHRLRANIEDAIAAADLLLATGTRADADSARALLAPVLVELAGTGGGVAEEVRLRDAWVRAMTGDVEALRTAVAPRTGVLFRPHTDLPNRALWAGRFAPIALAVGNDDAAWRLVSPLAVASRGRDPFLTRLAREASAGRPFAGSFDQWLAAACRRADSLETAALRRHGVKPLAVRAADGVALHAWYVPGRPGAAIAVVAAPAEQEDAIACDSLLVQLRRAGLALAVLDPRGVRGSASEKDPSPVHWLGHEEAVARQLARDMGAALTAAARAGGVSAPRALAVGPGANALAAVLACGADPRFRAVLLAGPDIASVDRGWVRASLARSATPAFFETGPEDVTGNEAIDRIVAALPAAQTRVVDSRAPGRGAALFRAGPTEGARVAAWLTGALKPRPATPPARPR